jgi:hypothetical protein
MRNMALTAMVLVACLASGAFADIWYTKPSIPTAVYEGGGLAYGEFPLGTRRDSIYAQCGANADAPRVFYYFDVSGNDWHSLADLPANFNATNGGALCFAPAPNGYNRLWSLGGTNGFCNYTHNSSTGTWTTDATFTHYAGCALTYGGMSTSGTLGAYVYAFTGGNSQGFSRYFYATPSSKSPQDNLGSWSGLHDFGANVEHGALTYDTKYKSDGSKVYGIGAGDEPRFAGYYPTGNTWATLTAPSWASVGPGVSLAAQTVVFAVSDSTDSIFALRGDGEDDFSRYRISTAAWSNTPDDAPWVVGEGGALAFAPKNRYFYALRGAGTTDFAEYRPYSLDDGLQTVGGSVPTDRLVCVPMSSRSFRMSLPQTCDGQIRFSAVDITGREVWSTRSSDGQVVWNVEGGVSAGVYTVLATAGGRTVVGRVVLPR